MFHLPRINSPTDSLFGPVTNIHIIRVSLSGVLPVMRCYSSSIKSLCVYMVVLGGIPNDALGTKPCLSCALMCNSHTHFSNQWGSTTVPHTIIIFCVHWLTAMRIQNGQGTSATLNPIEQSLYPTERISSLEAKIYKLGEVKVTEIANNIL